MIKYCIVHKTGHDGRQEDGKFALFTARFEFMIENFHFNSQATTSAQKTEKINK